MAVTTHGIVAIADVPASRGEWWIIGVTGDGEVAFAFQRQHGERPIRFDLTADEAHELGTKLRLMARKAR